MRDGLAKGDDDQGDVTVHGTVFSVPYQQIMGKRCVFAFFFGFAKFLVASVTYGEPTSSKDYMHDVKTLNGAFGRKRGINGRYMVRPGIPFFEKKASSWMVSERCSFVQGFLLWMLYTGRVRHPGRGHPSGPFICIHMCVDFLSSSLLEAGYRRVIWRWNAKPTLWPLLSIDKSLTELEMTLPNFAKLAFRLFGPCLSRCRAWWSCWGWGSLFAWCTSCTSCFRHAFFHGVLSFGASHKGCTSFV